MSYTGTSHFVSFAAAVKYYRPYGETAQTVKQKLAEKAIAIGAPSAQRGQRVTVNQEGRYVIHATH